MDVQAEPEIVLYDLACTKNECFSPAVWRIRLMLNYKRVPYKTVFLEFQDIQGTLKGLGLTLGADQPKYTVPVIHHLPTDAHIMDSEVIARFLETTYPVPPVPGIGSEASEEIQAQLRRAAMSPFRTSITPREVLILSPPAAAYFRRTREPLLSGGQPLEVLLEGDKEEEAWQAADAELRELGEKLRARRGEGPFIFGEGPTWVDFTVVSNLQCARVVDEATFQRMVAYPGLREVYEAVLPFMGKKD